MGDCSVLLNVNKACFIKEERYFIIVMMCLCTPPILWRVIIVANLYVQIYALCKHFLPNKEHNNQQQNNFYATYWVLHLLDLLMLIRGGTLLPHPTSSMRARPKWLYHFQSFLSRSLALSSSSSNYVYSFTVSMLCIYGHQHVRVFSDVDCDIASTLSFEWIIEALSCHGLATVVDSMRESIHAICCDFSCLRASGPSRGKPVLICILACSFAIHAITLKSSIFMKIAFLKIKPV